MRPQREPCYAMDHTMWHLWVLVLCGPELLPHADLLLHLLSVWPHLQQCSHLVSGPPFVNSSTQYYTPTALMPSFTIQCTTLFTFTLKTIDDAEIPPICLLSLTLRGFTRHHTGTANATSSYRAWILPNMFCRPSVPLPMDLTSGTA